MQKEDIRPFTFKIERTGQGQKKRMKKEKTM
jgi:hypothetical protein